MAIDDFTDVPVATVAMLASGAANADLDATSTPDEVVTSTITWPIPAGKIPQQRLPLLAVYRSSEAWWNESSPYDARAMSVYRIEYWAQLTPVDRVASRWNLLHHVWHSIAKALQAGWHPEVSSGAEVLKQAGLRAEIGSTTRATYSLGTPTEGGIYPHFVADVTLFEEISDVVGVTDVDGLPDFELSVMQIDLHETTPPAGTPTITQTIFVEGAREPGFDEGFDMGFG